MSDMFPDVADVDVVEPIFRDSGQACYVAYLFCSMPASPKSPMFTAREMVEDGDLDSSRISGIRFGEHMSPLEIRGECARVIAHIEGTLKGVELDAIRAKYAHGQERLDAMVNVRNFMSSQCIMGIAKKAVTMITARIYGNSSTREMLSDKHIAGAVGGISRESVGIARRSFKREIFNIETRSLRKLSAVFILSGVSRS